MQGDVRLLLLCLLLCSEAISAFASSRFAPVRRAGAHIMMASSSNVANARNGSTHDVVHWAIVGLGDVCAVKAGPAFYKCTGSTLSAVMRRTPGAAQKWIDGNSNLPPDVASSMRAFDSVEQMTRQMSKEGKLDAVYVASPPGAHLENIRQIATAIDALPSNERRLRAVYVEKPCGRCAWETRAMIEELRARQVEFYPAYVSRAHERTQVLRRLLGEEKVCGDRVTSVRYTQRGSGFARGLDVADGSVPWRLRAEESGGGLIMDMGCHVLDRIDYLFGPIDDVKSTVLRNLRSYPLVEDYVEMSAKIGESDWSAVESTGATVECLWDFSGTSDLPDADELIISGPNGSLRMGGMGAGLPISVLDADGKLMRTLEFDAPEHAAQPLIQSVVNELRGVKGDTAGRSNDLARSPARADNAIRTSEVLDSILGTYYGGRHDEFWTRPNAWSGMIRSIPFATRQKLQI